MEFAVEYVRTHCVRTFTKVNTSSMYTHFSLYQVQLLQTMSQPNTKYMHDADRAKVHCCSFKGQKE